jgi:hypothetical protein
MGLLLGISQAKDGHGEGVTSTKGGGHDGGGSSNSPSSTGQYLNQSMPDSDGGGADNESNSNEASVPTTILGQAIGQVYLIIVGIVIGTSVMYMMCTCRVNRIQKGAFQQKVELMKQEVVLDCENNHSQSNNDHNSEMAAPFASPVDGRYISTYMKPWEAFKSGACFTFSTRHDGGSGWLIRGTGMNDDGSFTITEGLLSESGKAYWVEKCDELGHVAVTSGTFHLTSMRDGSNTCFNGSWHGDNGTRGIYWSFRLATDSTDMDDDFSDIGLEHDYD